MEFEAEPEESEYDIIDDDNDFESIESHPESKEDEEFLKEVLNPRRYLQY